MRRVWNAGGIVLRIPLSFCFTTDQLGSDLCNKALCKYIPEIDGEVQYETSLKTVEHIKQLGRSLRDERFVLRSFWLRNINLNLFFLSVFKNNQIVMAWLFHTIIEAH